MKEHIRWIIGDSQVTQQIAEATATQQNMDFQIPGVPEPTFFKTTKRKEPRK